MASDGKEANSKRSGLKWAAALVGVMLLLAAGTLAFINANIADWTKRLVVDRAKQQGIILELSDVDVSLSAIHLREARARLDGVAGLTIYLQSVDLSLLGLKLDRIRLKGAIVQAVGAPTQLLNDVRAWQAKHPLDSAMPKPEIGKAKLTWQETLDGPPFVELDNVTFVSSAKPLGPLGQDISIQAEHAQVGAYALAPFAAAVHSELDSLEIGLGSTQWESMTARGGWRKQPTGDELHVSVGPLPLEQALTTAGIKLDDPKLQKASAIVAISLLRTADAAWPYQGHVAIELADYTPPHPSELQGFDFGKSTRIDTAFRVDTGLSAMNLLDTRITAGQFKLAGHGNVRRTAALSGRIQLELKGKLPCTSLATALATSKLGQNYGNWVARHASEAISGSVDVTLQIDADSNALAQAKVARIVGIGCGLRPLSVHQLLTLDLPPAPDMELIRRLGKDIPAIGGKLPDLTHLGLPDIQIPDWGKSKQH